MRITLDRQRSEGLRYLAAALGIVALMLSGCGGKLAPSTSQTPSTTPAAATTLPFEAQTFSSRQLGISFRCPRGWRVQADLSDFPSWGLASVEAITRVGEERQAGVTLLIKCVGIAKGEEPGPYLDAPLSYRADTLEFASASHEPITDVGFTRLGGLRLLSYQSKERIRPNEAAWPSFHLYSRNTGDGASPTQVIINAGAPDRDWSAQRETLLAVLSTMRFSTPRVDE
jgi:hypothetical protein